MNFIIFLGFLFSQVILISWSRCKVYQGGPGVFYVTFFILFYLSFKIWFFLKLNFVFFLFCFLLDYPICMILLMDLTSSLDFVSALFFNTFFFIDFFLDFISLHFYSWGLTIITFFKFSFYDVESWIFFFIL